MTIICNPQIEICVLEERHGHQTGNILAVHGNISLNGPKVHVLSSGVDVSTQTRNEGLHKPHQQHIFDEERIEFRGQETGYQFDRPPCIGALVVSLKGHDGVSGPIKCHVGMLRVAKEIAPVLLAARRTAGDEMQE